METKQIVPRNPFDCSWITLGRSMKRVRAVHKLVEGPAGNNLRSIFRTRYLCKSSRLLLCHIVFRKNRVDQEVRNKLQTEVHVLLEDRRSRHAAFKGGIRFEMAARGFDCLCDFE